MNITTGIKIHKIFRENAYPPTYTEQIPHSALTNKFLHSKGYISKGYICEPLVNSRIWKMEIPILLAKGSTSGIKENIPEDTIFQEYHILLINLLKSGSRKRIM